MRSIHVTIRGANDSSFRNKREAKMSILRFGDGDTIYVKFAAGEVQATSDELWALCAMWADNAAKPLDRHTTPDRFDAYDDELTPQYTEMDTDCD